MNTDDQIERKIKSISRPQTELQSQFMKIVEEMIKDNVELPDNFELFYRVMNHSDRRGRVIQIKPFLTKLSATNDCKEDKKNDCGKK